MGRGIAHPLGPVLRDELGGVEPFGDHHDDRLDRERLLERGGALGRARARLVRIEREHSALGEPGEQGEMFLAEGRPARGDDVVDAGLREPDHVGVALDHEGFPRTRDRRPRAMEVVEDLLLAIDGCFRGVEVLGLFARALVARQYARAETDVATLEILDGERDPAVIPRSVTFARASSASRPPSSMAR